jgi:D-apionolactonase
MVDRAVALFGTTQPLPKRVELKAGPVTAVLESGALRWIRYRGIEVLRGIAFLVRDRSWNTASPLLSNLEVHQTEAGFQVRFDALCQTGDGKLPWSAEITGNSDGLSFTGTAAPEADFLTNRTGFVLLHPLEGVAGCPVELTYVDGSRRQARFPLLVDPEQCFFDLRALSHEVLPGVTSVCRMEGDAWEMEDHRNWLDASFKTYVRPLALPYPYKIEGGSKVAQKVTLSFAGSSSAAARAAAEGPVEVALKRESGGRMPVIGLRAPLQWMDLAADVTGPIRQAGPGLINGRIDPRAGHGVKEIRALGDLASAVAAGLALELVVPCRRDPSQELAEFAAQLRQAGVHPESVMLAAAEDRIRLEPGAPPPPLALLGEIHWAARAALPGVAIGGGTFGFFTELNRNWPPVGLIDFIGHMVCSVVHASDDRAIVENLESFAHITRTVRAFAGRLPYRLISASIGLDIGPYGESAANPDNLRSTMVRADPRHRALFGAVWTLAAIAEAAYGGLAAISPAAVVGELGIVHRRLAYGQPWFDDLDRPAVYPAYHVVAGMAPAAGRPLLEAVCSDPRRIAALAYRTPEGGVCLWLANLWDLPQRLRMVGLESQRAARLDQSTFEAAALDPSFLKTHVGPPLPTEFEIGPHGILQIQIRS